MKKKTKLLAPQLYSFGKKKNNARDHQNLCKIPMANKSRCFSTIENLFTEYYQSAKLSNDFIKNVNTD